MRYRARRFIFSLERQNKFSVKSTDSGDRLVAWVQILALLLTSSVTLTKSLDLHASVSPPVKWG